jgi:lipopolysaccharide/colanic/teichoic acid biosynthesis glycosyltransferase
LIYEFFKRIIDLILCIPIFVVWLLLHPWVTRQIKKEDGGEVYSIQERLGRYNKVIYIKKYRTMNFTDKGVWLEQSENKVTNIGRFLRRTRIDELPQIFSVIKGDLSFIGPRTDIVNLGEKLAKEVPFYNLRYSVTPGLSGWAQTMMDYQPRTVNDSIERLRYDLYYVKNRSLFLDLLIMLRTIKTILSREGM